MPKLNKLQKFAELLRYPNVLENFNTREPGLIGENGIPVDLKGHWQNHHFRNNHPLTLELACGRGEYTLGLAALHPQRNYVGVDVKGARIWKGAAQALERGLNNVAFLRTRIEQLDLFFAPGEVQEIWITFPDPFLLDSRANKRLTSPFFLSKYRQVIAPGALLHLKTDEYRLYEYTLRVLARDPQAQVLQDYSDVYQKSPVAPELSIQTHYERQHLAAGKTIKYIQFKLNHA